MSKKFSDEDRRRILSEARETLERRVEQPPTLVREVEDPVAQWKREADEQAQREARDRVARDTRPLLRRIAALEHDRDAAHADIERLWDLIGEIVESARHITDAIDDLQTVASKPAQAASEHVEAMLKRVEAKIDELNPRREVIDLPALPLRSVN